MTAPTVAARLGIRIVGHAEVDPGSIQPHPLNWREHPPHQRAALDGSLEEYGWIRSVLVNKRTGRLIDGHLRLAAAQERGDASIPVEIIDVSEDEERGILATLDPIAGLATANAERYAALTSQLELRSEALRDLIASIERPVMQAGRTDPDSLPDEIEPRAKLGELWTLGEHRLLCGDATDGKQVARLWMNGDQPLLMITDPPYGVDYDPAWRVEAAAAGHLAYAARRVGEVANDDREDWRDAWYLFPGDVVYAWAPPGPTHISHHQALAAAGFDVRMEMIWSKPHFPISRGHYHVRHEPCLYAVRRGATAHWIGDRKQTTIWEITLDQNVAGGHSTQKPVECMARPMRNHSGDVYDPFLGSGTTLIAAEQLGRRCYALEVEPKYVDVSLARWEAFTGKTAKLESRS